MAESYLYKGTIIKEDGFSKEDFGKVNGWMFDNRQDCSIIIDRDTNAKERDIRIIIPIYPQEHGHATSSDKIDQIYNGISKLLDCTIILYEPKHIYASLGKKPAGCYKLMYMFNQMFKDRETIKRKSRYGKTSRTYQVNKFGIQSITIYTSYGRLFIYYAKDDTKEGKIAFDNLNNKSEKTKMYQLLEDIYNNIDNKFPITCNKCGNVINYKEK